MQTIAFFNLKGGVGKTTSAVNIAALAAAEGIPTVLWDLDPQGAAGFMLGESAVEKTRPKKLIKGKKPIGELIINSSYPNLDVIPADFSMRHLDHYLADFEDKKNPLQKLVAPLGEKYSLLVIDCPPSFSTLSEQVFDCANELFIPVIPSKLSLRTFETTRDFFRTSDELRARHLHAFFNMVDRRRALHRAIIAHPPSMLKHRLGTAIPYAADVEKMSEKQAPLGTYSARNPAWQAYQALWLEIKTLLKR